MKDLKKDENTHYKLLVKELQKRKCFSLSNKTIFTSKTKNEEMKISPQLFVHNYILEEEFHYNSLQLSEVQKNEKIKFPERKAEPLILYFLSTIFVHMSEHITLQ